MISKKEAIEIMNPKVLTLDDLNNMECPCGCNCTDELALNWCDKHKTHHEAIVYYRKDEDCFLIACADCSVRTKSVIHPYRITYIIELDSKSTT